MTDTLPPISHQIWDKKYRFKEFDGTPIDQSMDDTWRRVAKALAAAEDGVINQTHWEKQFYGIMVSREFSPAGRIISGAGTGRAVTLANCYTMGTIPDSMDGIFSHLKEAALTMQQGGGIGPLLRLGIAANDPAEIAADAQIVQQRTHQRACRCLDRIGQARQPLDHQRGALSA